MPVEVVQRRQADERSCRELQPPFDAAPQDTARGAGQPPVHLRHRYCLRETELRSHGRRTSRAVCATGHPGCSWKRSAARLTAPAGTTSTSTPQHHRPVANLPVREPKEKAALQRVHRCECGITEHRDLFSAYLGLHVHSKADGSDRLEPGGSQSWLASPSGHRRVPRPSRSIIEPARPADIRPRGGQWRRIKARRKAKAAEAIEPVAQTSTTNRPTALPT